MEKSTYRIGVLALLLSALLMAISQVFYANRVQAVHPFLHAIVLSIIAFQKGLQTQCSRSYEAFTPKIETIVKEELGRAFKELLAEKYPNWTEEKLKIKSTMISWSLYGISMNYVVDNEQPTDGIIKTMYTSLLAE